MSSEEIEIVARVLMRRMYNEETSRAQEGDDTGLWKVVKEDAQAAITALDQYREGKAKADQPRRDFLFMAAGLYPFDLEKSVIRKIGLI